MQSKVSEAMAKKETLKARAASAEATRQLAADLNGVLSGLRTSDDGLAAFRRMEMKVEAMEAEAEAAGQVSFYTPFQMLVRRLFLEPLFGRLVPSY